jgi:hypothetical protein
MSSKVQPAIACNSKEVELAFDAFTAYRNSSRGRLFTVIEAVIPNEQQCKATKDLIDTIIWDEYHSRTIFEEMTKLNKKE